MTKANPSATATPPWIVVKYGGTSVSSRASWDSIAATLRALRSSGHRVLIVVSALTGITDRLHALGEPGVADARRQALLREIADRHHGLIAELALADATLLDGPLAELARLCPAAGDASSPAAQARLLSQGELLSSTLGAAYLRAAGLAVAWIDAREWLDARVLPNQTPRTRYLSATVPAEPDRVKADRLAEHGDLLITQGFIARDEGGGTVVLGRGGSDTSAGCFGALLQAERVEIWTDVPGLFSADPRRVPDARLLARLDYEEAQEIATSGAKVLHPRCLSPVRRARVPLVIKDTRRPGLPGTVISRQVPGSAPCVKAINVRKGVTLVAMDTVGMWQQVGFLADVFAEFKRHGLSVDLIGSAETNVTVSLDPAENLLTSGVVAALAADLAKICRVRVIAPCAAVTLVGRGMRSLLHRLSGVLAEFGAIDVHLISQSANNLNLTFVVDERLVDELIPRLHELLIRADAMRIDDGEVFGPSWRELERPRATPPAAPWWRARGGELLRLAAAATPHYVYALDVVRAQAASLHALPAVDRWHYALKANPHPAILRALGDSAFGFECVSQGELEALFAAIPGLAPERVLFTPNFAPRGEYAAALAHGVHVTLDALHPLRHWGELFEGRDIWLRVDPGFGRGHHDKVRTGGSASKFGVALADVAEFMRLAGAAGARVTGLHAHAGSGILDDAHWRSLYADLASLAESLGGIVHLDIGGGLGVPSRPGEAPLDLAALGAALAEVRAAYPQFELWLEPGRFLVAEAGVLLARVTQTKRKGDVAFVGVDAGMHTLLRPALYGAWHEIVNLSRPGEPPAGLVQVVGPICESGDVLGANRRLPECREGDVLLIARAGAYGAVMASRYNLRSPAAETVLDSGASPVSNDGGRANGHVA